MRKKVILLLFILPLIFSGCADSRKIENAAVIENVCVSQSGGQTVYTFYPLTDGEPQGVNIVAASFEEAQEQARTHYIPNMTLAKLELLMIDSTLDRRLMQSDIEYISTQASVSPVAYVTLCDNGVLRRVARDNDACQMIENELILCKNNNPKVNIDYLSVFNSFDDNHCPSFSVPLVTGEDNLKISTTEIEKM